MKFLVLTAFLYFGFLYYQNSLIAPTISIQSTLSQTRVIDDVDYSKYYQPQVDIFAMRSMDDSVISPSYKMGLYSIVDSLHVLPFVRNFLQKSYTMSDWVNLSSGFYFSFSQGDKGLDFVWVSPSSEKILSKLSKKQRGVLNFGGVAQLKWSVYDTLYIKLSKNKRLMILSSSKKGTMRLPSKLGQKSLLTIKRGFISNLKYLLKNEGLDWVNENVDSITLNQEKSSYELNLDLVEGTKFYKSFGEMPKYERYIKQTEDDLNFQINLSQALEMIDVSKLRHTKIKGAQFFLKQKALFDGSFFLRAKLFKNSPKFQLQSTFKNPGSSGRFISELESYVSQKSMDLAKMNQNEYSLVIPFSPIQFFLKRIKKEILLSNGGTFSNGFKETDKKALLYFALSNIGKKELLVPHIDRLIRSYHKKRIMTCFENLSKKDALFKYCPMGGNYSVINDDVICDIHGSEQSSNFINLVQNDLRRPLAKSLIANLQSIKLSLFTSDRGLNLKLSL